MIRAPGSPRTVFPGFAVGRPGTWTRICGRLTGRAVVRSGHVGAPTGFRVRPRYGQDAGAGAGTRDTLQGVGARSSGRGGLAVPACRPNHHGGVTAFSGRSRRSAALVRAALQHGAHGARAQLLTSADRSPLLASPRLTGPSASRPRQRCSSIIQLAAGGGGCPGAKQGLPGGGFPRGSVRRLCRGPLRGALASAPARGRRTASCRPTRQEPRSQSSFSWLDQRGLRRSVRQTKITARTPHPLRRCAGGCAVRAPQGRGSQRGPGVPCPRRPP
ncbi:hypothetical protein SAMN05428944_0129 [Streptomyces sp. 1222.5]|nr:hypothetical protein BX260_0126 [Streptomyces sp. 5112.2]SEB54028.1 hypothetical protein SAMN05428944_0129 [Streptomyces sp. 1222.5]